MSSIQSKFIANHKDHSISCAQLELQQTTTIHASLHSPLFQY